MTPFEPGERVRVRSADKPGHVRTPEYLKGKTGRVEAILGEFRNPEVDLWSDYEGPDSDRLYADVYEQWLEHDEGGSA